MAAAVNGHSQETEDEGEERQEGPSVDSELPTSGQKRKRSAPKEREFVEVNQWCKDDFNEEQIDAAIKHAIDSMNRDARMPTKLVGLHKDRFSRWGAFTMRRKWPSNKNLVINYILSCPYAGCHKCQCEVKIVDAPRTVVMYLANR